MVVLIDRAARAVEGRREKMCKCGFFKEMTLSECLFFFVSIFFRVICMHGAQLRDAYKVKRDGKDSYEFRTSGHQTMPPRRPPCS